MSHRNRSYRTWRIGCALAGAIALGACSGPGEAADEQGTAGTGGTGGSTANGGTGGLQPPVRDLRCSSDDECCAVVDECYDQLWLVTQGQKTEVEAYIASLQRPSCFACIPPSVQVSCQNGQCVGVEVGVGTWPPSGLSGTHCGVLPTNGTGGAPPSSSSRLMSDPPTAGSAPTKFGCGPL